MPLSWLPLISDYTREAKEPVKATAVSTVVYGVVSCFMYLVGMGAALFTGESDIAQIMVKAGLGIAGLLIIVFSTVTTTFLDAYSAGISSESIFAGLKGKVRCCSCNSDRYHRSNCLSDGRYHRFPVSDRLCICANDRSADCRFLYSEKGKNRKQDSIGVIC